MHCGGYSLQPRMSSGEDIFFNGGFPLAAKEFKSVVLLPASQTRSLGRMGDHWSERELIAIVNIGCLCQHVPAEQPRRLKTRWSSPINVFKVKVTKTMDYCCSKFIMLVVCLSCRDNSTLNVCLCRPTMTLHQGQGHRHEHEQICHAYVYLHAKCECNSLKVVRDMAIIVQVKHLSTLMRSCDFE